MSDISAATVMKLRKISGQGMMDCKKALEETNGDMDAAMELLRKKGLATMAKRAGRETTEGRVISTVTPDGKSVAMVALCCETDFVAKSEDFVAAADLLGKYAIEAAEETGAEVLMETKVDGRSFAEILTEVVSKTGEKTEIGEYHRITLDQPGVVGMYVHFNNKTGAMVQVETDSDATATAIKQVADEVAMHVTAMKPVSVDKDSIDPEVIKKEREIATEQMQGKPANIIEKIVDGKINKFLQDNCLVYQPFVKDDSKTVEQAVSEAAKAAGGQAKIKRFVRVEIG